jgi:ABC-2 type transport system permease protein
MRHLPTIFFHELRVLMLAPSTYIAAVLFLGVMGFIFAGILESYNKEAQDLSPSFVFFSLFWLPVLFMVPLLTMKCLAEERRAGTLETLLTTPVSTAEVVLGKFAASYALYLFMWLLTIGFMFILDNYAQDARFLDPGPLIGGYVFVAVSGLLFVSVGVLASSLSRSQAVAGVLAFALLFAIIVGTRLVSDLTVLQQEGFTRFRDTLDNVQVMSHLQDFTRGIIDTRQIVFYLSGTALALIFSILGVEGKVLRS